MRRDAPAPALFDSPSTVTTLDVDVHFARVSISSGPATPPASTISNVLCLHQVVGSGRPMHGGVQQRVRPVYASSSATPPSFPINTARGPTKHACAAVPCMWCPIECLWDPTHLRFPDQARTAVMGSLPLASRSREHSADPTPRASGLQRGTNITGEGAMVKNWSREGAHATYKDKLVHRMSCSNLWPQRKPVRCRQRTPRTPWPYGPPLLRR